MAAITLLKAILLDDTEVRLNGHASRHCPAEANNTEEGIHIVLFRDADAALAIALARENVPTAYLVVASAAVLVHDYLCTLDLEVNHVWFAPSLSRLGTVLFFLNRYSPFVDVFFSLHRQVSPMSVKACKAGMIAITYMTVLGIMISEIVLFARTYALWARKRAVWFFLVVPTIASLATFVSAVLEIRSAHYVALPWPQLPGCTLGAASQIIFTGPVLLMICETLVLVLTLIKVVPMYRRSPTPLITKLYYEGILFYAYLLGISTINVILPLVLPTDYTAILLTPQRVAHSLLCTRVLLVRATARSVSSGRASDALALSGATSDILSLEMRDIPRPRSITVNQAEMYHC